ncbi:membrane protein [Planotetraspora thailandica]|uniref:Membrane protein n=1 Tax=Planotetraspora thailandica TaxID=487172 RepID=A0A8J3XY19_9ACTN|nr:DedA family protein [Planotetraspora thailandica]GII53748.1 membrane protein [Planotetraspora thailandica]
MTDAILDLLRQVMASPWVYLLLFAVALVDAFFPAVPSETAVITAGVFAATGGPDLAAVIAVAALGAFAGDHVSYLAGRTAGRRVLGRLRPGTRGRAAADWAERTLAERGGLLLVVARYVPGGRTAATLTAGAGGYPLRRFTLFDAIATVSWAAYSTLIGFVGGMAFEHDPMKGLLLGLGIAIGVTVVIETVRHLRGRAARRQAPDGEVLETSHTGWAASRED